MQREKVCRRTSIGGQAVIEGIMMRGVDRSALAVRKPDGEIDVEVTELKNARAWYKRTPLIRGCFNFIDTLRFGYGCLMRSAEKSGMLEEEQPGKFEQWLIDRMGDKATKVLSAFASVVGVILAVGLFFFMPTLLVKWIDGMVPLGGWKSVIEGVIKILLFLGYLFAVSRMSEIHRVFEYHGAEHKTIACYEADEELTVENVKKHIRFHPRCGTSFLLIVLIVSILVSSAVTWSNGLLRVAIKLLLLPVVVSIAYEIIKLAGRYDNILTRIVSAPGLWMQNFTTFEPDDSQMEVAIAAMKAVIPDDPEDAAW